MTRAVAEIGTELMEGIHKGHSRGLAITIKQANGLVRDVPWDIEDGATPILIEAMILNLEIKDPELREATRKYSLDFLRGWVALFDDLKDGYNIPMSLFYSRAEAFVDGYQAAFTKIKPYWKNPLPVA